MQGGFRAETDGAAEVRDGLLGPPQFLEDHAEVVVRATISRLKLHGDEVLDRLVTSAHSLERRVLGSSG